MFAYCFYCFIKLCVFLLFYPLLAFYSLFFSFFKQSYTNYYILFKMYTLLLCKNQIIRKYTCSSPGNMKTHRRTYKSEFRVLKYCFIAEPEDGAAQLRASCFNGYENENPCKPHYNFKPCVNRAQILFPVTDLFWLNRKSLNTFAL